MRSPLSETPSSVAFVSSTRWPVSSIACALVAAAVGDAAAGVEHRAVRVAAAAAELEPELARLRVPRARVGGQVALAARDEAVHADIAPVDDVPVRFVPVVGGAELEALAAGDPAA